MHAPGRERLLASLADDVAALTRCLGGDLARPVAACPGWDVLALARHLAGVHRWATAAVTEATPGRPPAEPEPAPGTSVADWFVDGAARLQQVLAETDPDAPCWGMGPPPRTAAFWLRRQAHETAVHRWDAQDAQGGAGGLDPVLAADGVDEVATIFLPRQVRLGRREPLPAPVRLVCSDAATSVVLGEGPPVATVTGRAADLLLVCWGRRDAGALLAAGALTVTGDSAAARTVLGSPLTP